MKRTMLKVLPVALSMALVSGTAQADEEGFHGYFRAGAGTSSKKGPQSCFGLGGNTMKYRLGNECDGFGEFGYTKELVKMDNGVSFLGTVWVDVFSPNSDFGDAKLGMSKAYVEARGLDFLNGGSAWAGKRHYNRPEIHILDLQYINMNGTGAGLDRIPMGPGKFSYAFFKDNDLNVLDPVSGAVTGTTAATRQSVIYAGVPVNTNGTLDVAASIITAQGGDNTHNGWMLSLFHNQAKVMGGVNQVGVQYAVGPGTGLGGPCCNRMGASGSTSLSSDVKRWRVFDQLWIQPTDHFGMAFVALVQKDTAASGNSSTWTTLGVRPVYAFTKNFKLQMELGTDRVTSSTGGPAQRLTKITFAPTISAGPGLWSRPELRAFVTYGKWNDAATASVNASNNSGPVYGNGRSGASAGFQVETWF